ncbi:MAG: cytochrome P450, partial [Spongiibacteraceae bacterium]
TKPDYVPADRVYDFDIYNFPVENAEYQLALKKLTAPNIPEVFWTPRNGGHWLVTRSVEINKVLSDYAHFSSRTVVVPKPDRPTPPFKPLQIDPPDHVKFRNIIAGHLSPKAVTQLAETARALTIELIEGFKAKGECEFISEFAQHLPIAIFMKIVDLPESDRGMLTDWAEVAMRGETDDERVGALMQFVGYGLQKTKERRTNPGTDMFSAIAAAKIDGEYLDDDTMGGMVLLMLTAGLDTVASMLGFFALFLARHPGHRQQLIADPSLIPNATEELLRRFPIAILAREVVEDYEFAGVTLRAGDMVVMPSQLDGLDDRRFENAETVDFSRKIPTHATFGGGTHRCMGAMLARTELRIFLEEWLKRIPDFEVKPGAEASVIARTVATITSLPLVWKVR